MRNGHEQTLPSEKETLCFCLDDTQAVKKRAQAGMYTIPLFINSLYLLTGGERGPRGQPPLRVRHSEYRGLKSSCFVEMRAAPLERAAGFSDSWSLPIG